MFGKMSIPKKSKTLPQDFWKTSIEITNPKRFPKNNNHKTLEITGKKQPTSVGYCFLIWGTSQVQVQVSITHNKYVYISNLISNLLAWYWIFKFL